MRAELRARVEWGYRVAEAVSAQDGIERAFSLAPDLVVTDVTVPDLDGVALLTTLRDDGRTRHVPVVLLSAGLSGREADPLGLAAGLGRLLCDWEPLLLDPDLPAPPDTLDAADAAFLADVDACVRRRMASVEFGAGALAEALGLIPRQLRRRLGRITGETPGQHIRRVRLERGVEMLQDGEASVKGAAYATGFASTSGFRAAFRSMHGVSPSGYVGDASRSEPSVRQAG